jgi:hypothetical protein
MPVMPTYQQRTEATGTLSANADPGAFGAATAQAGQRLGAAIESVGKTNALLLREQQERDARAWSGKTVSQATLQWMDTLAKRKQDAPAGAPNFAGTLVDDFDKYANETIDNAPTPLAKQYLQQHMNALRTSLGDSAITFEAKARVENRDQQGIESINNWAKVVQQQPGLYGVAMNSLRETLPQGAIEGDKLSTHAKATLSAAAASQVLDADPYKMQDYTSKALGDKGFQGKVGVPWIDDATPEQIKTWNNQATTKIRMLEAEQARAIDAREKIAQDTFNAATDLSFKGQYMSPSYTAQLLEQTKGTRFEQAAREIVDSQKTTAGFASAPATTRTQVLNDWRARGSTPGVGTTPEDAKQLEKVATIDAEIQKAAKDNPWQAAQKYAVTTDASVMPINSAQDAIGVIAKRSQTQTTIETWVGRPVSPLQPIEAAALSQQLEKLPPPARAQALGTLGSMLTLPRLVALADQLDQHDKAQALAMKLGGDSTTAGRPIGELVLRGAQAIKDKTIKKDDTAIAGWRADIANMVRGTLGDDRAENDAIDAAYYIRAAMENDGTPAPGFSLKASTENAVRFAIGQPMERNGVKTLLPRGMSQGDFDKKLEAFTPDALRKIAPGGTVYVRGQATPIDRVSSSLGRMGMRRDGNGNFIPVSGNAMVTLDPEGRTPLRLLMQ